MNQSSSPNYRYVPASLLVAWMEEARRQSEELTRQKTTITKNLSATRQTLVDIHAEIQRRAEVSWRNRLRLGLRPIPPMVSTPSSIPPTPSSIHPTPAPVPPPPPPTPAIASIPIKEQGNEQGWVELRLDESRTCGECANFRIERTGVEEHRGYCFYVDDSVGSRAPASGCPRFDPLPKPSPQAVSALDSLATPEEMEICDVRR
ncbi:hypothetical protein L6R29_25560 [Myxococcota bacterium]|nr:hypothetical protein [Myxococcota bacterium]